MYMKTQEQRREYDRLYKRRWRKTDAAKRQKLRLLEFKRYLKAGSCIDCGNSYPPIAMEFDHLPDVKKSFKISQNNCRAPQTILLEIEKCELVCVLCHRNRTYNRYKRSDSRTARARRRLHQKVAELKNRPCEICNNRFNPWQMDFDHLDPSDKIEKVTEMVRKRRALDAILKEISKCRLLCALCHRLWTEKQSHE